MFGDNKDYIFFVIVLLLAIGISLLFHIFVQQNLDASFSELYFSDPDKLPNKINLGQKYNFTFTARNLENKPSTYQYNSKVELFNLYDITEGLYKCASRSRKKVDMHWVGGNDSTRRIYKFTDAQYGNTSFIFSEIEDMGYVDWPYYTIEFRFENFLDTGSFVTAFYDKDKIKYTITIFYDTSEIVLTYKDNGNIRQEIKKLSSIQPNNEVLINTNRTLKYYLNKKLIFNVNTTNLTFGKLGFRMDNSYISIGDLIMYKDSPIEVTQISNVKEFNIDNSIIEDKIRGLRKASEEVIYLGRQLLNFTKECDFEECSEVTSFLNKRAQKYFLETQYNYFNETLLLGLIDAGNDTLFPNLNYYQNVSSPEIDWPNFTIYLPFEIFVKPHTFLVSLDKEMSILFHNSDLFFIIKNDRTNTIYKKSSPVHVGFNELVVESTDYNSVFKVNDIPLFNIRENRKFNDLSLYTKNTFAVFADIVVSSQNGDCRKVPYGKGCKRIYKVPSERRISSRDEARVSAQPIQINDGMVATPFLNTINTLDLNTSFENFTNITSVPKSGISQLLDYEIEIDKSQINEEIPSEKYIFDGRNARLANQLNYTFSFDFYILEGAGLIETTFFNNDKTKFTKLIINQPRSEVHLLTNNRDPFYKNTANLKLEKNVKHTLEIMTELNTTTFTMDQNPIFQYEGKGMSSGFFSIFTYYTYADIQEMTFFDRNTKRRIPFLINVDPCRLRKISDTAFDKGSLYLDENESAVIPQTFIVNQDFDYGIVNVTLDSGKSKKNEIHFWVVKND